MAGLSDGFVAAMLALAGPETTVAAIPNARTHRTATAWLLIPSKLQQCQLIVGVPRRFDVEVRLSNWIKDPSRFGYGERIRQARALPRR